MLKKTTKIDYNQLESIRKPLKNLQKKTTDKTYHKIFYWR